MEKNVDSLSVAALICGLVSIFIFPLLFGITGIGLGLWVMGNVEDKGSRAYANGRIGVIAGTVGLVLWVLTLAAMGILGFDANSLLGAGDQPHSAF